MVYKVLRIRDAWKVVNQLAAGIDRGASLAMARADTRFSLAGRIIYFSTVAALLIALLPSHGEADSKRFPHFMSLKSNPVNLRRGPGLNFPKTWIFRRAGLPVEVLREHGRWREIRDSDGATGWVFQALTSRRRTALVAPWKHKELRSGSSNWLTDLRRSARSRADVVAKLEPGTLVNIRRCDKRTCYVSIDDFAGYIEKNSLWGVYPQELIP